MPVDSLAAIEAALRARLARPLPGPDAQRRFAPAPARKGWRPDDQPPHARRASALILVYPGPDGPSIPLTLRHADLPHHGGQVSLPGGRIDGDETPDEAALREADEELGISPRHVRLIGALSSLWVVVSNHLLFPFVGVADERPDFAPAAREVTALIEAPVAALRDPSRRGWDVRARDGVEVRFPYFEVAGHRVWGATGMVLSEFVALWD